MERINYTHKLPESFTKIPVGIYQDAGLVLNENLESLEILMNLFKDDQELIVYTDHLNVRMLGIFPKGTNIAYFGFWETTNVPGLNDEAFRLLKEDAKTRNCSQVIGPINFNTYLAYRIRIGKYPSWKQFDREPVNPTYYLDILLNNGFKVITEYESRMIAKETIKDVYFSKESLLRDLGTIPFDFIPITSEFWEENREELYHLIHETFGDNPFYRKITFEQFNYIFNCSFVNKLCPHSSVTFRDQKSGRLAAISLCHPNYMELEGKYSNINYKDHYSLLEKKTLLAKSVGVHPDFRKNGLMNFLGAYGMISFQEYYDEVLFCLMREGNVSLRFSNYFPHDKSMYALFSYDC